MNTYVKSHRYSCAHRFPKSIQYCKNIASVPPLFCFAKTKNTLFMLYWKPETKGGLTLPWQKKVGHCLNLNKLKLQMRWNRYKTWTLHGLWNGLWTALESIKFNLVHKLFLLVRGWGVETRLGHLRCTIHIPLSTMV